MNGVFMMATMVTYPVFDKETRANPQAVYAQMRAETPVYRGIGPVTGNAFWFLTRYEDCVAALKEPRFGKEFRKHLPPEMLERYPPSPPELEMLDHHLLNLDPPDHTRLRSLVHKAFTPRMIQNLTGRIEHIA